MYKYKNTTQQEQLVPGVGIVAAGGEVDTLAPLENPNFELISRTETNSVVGTEAQQPNAVAEANKVAPQNNLEVK